MAENLIFQAPEQSIFSIQYQSNSLVVRWSPDISQDLYGHVERRPRPKEYGCIPSNFQHVSRQGIRESPTNMGGIQSLALLQTSFFVPLGSHIQV
jgi:hypothetical protein